MIPSVSSIALNYCALILDSDITAALGLSLEKMSKDELESTKDVMHSILQGVSCMVFFFHRRYMVIPQSASQYEHADIQSSLHGPGGDQ